MSTKTIQQLEQENADLKRLLEKTRQQLQIALEDVARNYGNRIQADIEKRKRGEYHHRAFERICPMPNLESITILKSQNI